MKDTGTKLHEAQIHPSSKFHSLSFCFKKTGSKNATVVDKKKDREQIFTLYKICGCCCCWWWWITWPAAVDWRAAAPGSDSYVAEARKKNCKHDFQFRYKLIPSFRKPLQNFSAAIGKVSNDFYAKKGRWCA